MPPSLKLLEREEIIRRLKRTIGPKFVQRPDEITRNDIAKWFGVDVRMVREHCDGVRPISDFWQGAYSQFFALVDAGLIVIRYEARGKKRLERVAKPETPVKKTLRPFVDGLLAGTPTLRFD